MSSSQRAVRAIRFEQMGGEFALVVTLDVGSEIVVEQVSLGAIDGRKLSEAVSAALRDLQQRHAELVSAA